MTLGNFMTLVDIVNTGGSFFFGNIKETLLEPFFLMALHKGSHYLNLKDARHSYWQLRHTLKLKDAHV